MVVIKTKVLATTDTKGTRIKAMANGFSVTIGYPYAESDHNAHFEAVKALVEKHTLSWNLDNMGYGSDNEGYYFTFASSRIGV